MDFGKINTRDAADKGAELHLKHPILGHKLYVGEGSDPDGLLVDRAKEHHPVKLRVRGYHSATVQKIGDAIRKEGLRGTQSDEFGEDLVDALIISWDNVLRDGKPLPITPENKMWLCDQDPGIFEQINGFAQDRSNFFTKGSQG